MNKTKQKHYGFWLNDNLSVVCLCEDIIMFNYPATCKWLNSECDSLLDDNATRYRHVIFILIHGFKSDASTFIHIQSVLCDASCVMSDTYFSSYFNYVVHTFLPKLIFWFELLFLSILFVNNGTFIWVTIFDTLSLITFEH